jgi:hypothetical protein
MEILEHLASFWHAGAEVSASLGMTCLYLLTNTPCSLLTVRISMRCSTLWIRWPRELRRLFTCCAKG